MQPHRFRNGDFDYLDYFQHAPGFAHFFAKYEKLAVIIQFTLLYGRP
jgi:hypothetical protein